MDVPAPRRREGPDWPSASNRSAARNHVRTVVLCVLRRGPDVLVARDLDRLTGQRYLRPPGGGVEFGEPSGQAVRREIREELGTELGDLRLLGVIENLFTFEGAAGHEIVFVYSARALNADIYALDEVPLTEDDGSRHAAVWVAADRLDDPAEPCYPPGLVELLAKEPE